MAKFKKLLTYSIIILFSLPSFALTKKWSSTLPQDSQFNVQANLKSRVQFWIDIYSKYSTWQGVFHNVRNPDLIYGTIDLSSIQNNSIFSEAEKNRQIKKMVLRQRKNIIEKFNIQSSTEIRLQMGLKDRMEKALFFSGRYLPMMEKIFADKNLPIELTRIVFVESSFNIFAQSKVGASGLWQIMPSVGRAEGYLQKYYDKRNHPYYATILAANMLKQNHRSLNNWPLAITAYNHGLTGVRRMKSKTGGNHINELIESDLRTQSWGFASENFYACFLAVLAVENKASYLFGSDLLKSKSLEVQNIKLKTATNKNQILKWYGGSLQKFKNYNPHLRLAQLKQKKYLPAGLPLVVPGNLVL